MNILFICDEYPPGNNGGIGTSVQNLARELVRQQHKVCVAGLYPYRYGQPGSENDQGVLVWRLRYSVKLPIHDDSRWYNAIEKLPAFIQKRLNGKQAFDRFIQFLEALIEKEKIDIIEIADYNNFCAHIGFIVKWPFFKIPLVLKSHGSYTYFCKELGMLPKNPLKETDKLLYERADALSAVSYYTTEVNRQLFHLDKQVQVLYNGITIPDNYSKIDRSSGTIVFTGSITYKKGVFSLAKAWNSVHKAFPNAKLLIFGKGNTDKLMKLLTPSARKSVFFKGHVPKASLYSELSKATFAVFPSYSETFGMGVVEAMSLGCPVIYTKRSCGPEIVTDGKDGLLVDPDNIQEIVDQMAKLLEDSDLRVKIGAEAFSSARFRFDIKGSASEHVSYYDQVIIKFNKQKKDVA